MTKVWAGSEAISLTCTQELGVMDVESSLSVQSGAVTIVLLHGCLGTFNKNSPTDSGVGT
jgi:hypothetical protein